MLAQHVTADNWRRPAMAACGGAVAVVRFKNLFPPPGLAGRHLSRARHFAPPVSLAAPPAIRRAARPSSCGRRRAAPRCVNSAVRRQAPCRLSRGVIMSRSPRMRVAGTVICGGGSERALIGVAGGEIVEQHAGPALFEHALRAAVHPQAGREAAAEFGLKSKAPDRDHVDGGLIVGFGGLEQIGADRHGRRRADQAERGDLAGCRAAVSSAISDPME